MDEDELLRAVALRNAESIRLAKQRAEDELLRTRDALERKTHELARSLAMMQATFEATPDGILVVDGDGHVTGVNANFVRMWQVPPAALETGEHRRILDALCRHVSDPAQFLARVDAIAAAARPDSFDLLQIDDNRVFERFSRVQVIEGRDVGRVWVFRDVTDRKRAEDALRLRDRAIQTLRQGVLITDPNRPDNPIIFANPGFEAMTGYAADEVLGRNCRFLQGKGTDPAAVALIRDAIRTGTPRTVELLNYRKDGTAFWNQLSISPVRDADGRIVNFVAIQSDITDRRRLEDQLRQSQKMEAVGQLAGGVAHDFNNLLTVINGYSEMVIGDLRQTDSLWGPLAAIRDAGQRAATLTAQLLAFSRKTIIEPKLLDLNALIIGSVKMLGRLVGEDIIISTALTPNPDRVKVDTGQMEQVLLNLVVNARDAMPQGGRLAIRTRCVDVAEGSALYPDLAPGRYVSLAVADTGFGIPDEVKAHIFEPFFTTKGIGKGTGLGLATIYGIAQTYGGCVTVESAVGSGTSVEFLLPAAAGEAVPLSREARPAPRGTETILVVEDDDLVRGMTRTALQALGYVVLDARSGVEALRLVADHGPIHLLITDVVMPGMSGRELAMTVGARYPGMKVLYVSGYTEDAVLRRGVREGVDAFLQKPFTPLLLGLKVRDVLGAPPRTG